MTLFGRLRARALCVAVAAVLPLTGHAQQAALTTDAQPSLRVDTGVPAVPTAQEVIVDLPSAFHAARHQRGDIRGLRYVLFPDGSGKVMQVGAQRAVLYRFECQRAACEVRAQDGARTTISATGTLRPDLPAAPDGAALVAYLSAWVLAANAPPPKAPVQEQIKEPEPETPASASIKTTAPDAVQSAATETPIAVAKPEVAAAKTPVTRKRPKPVSKPAYRPRAPMSQTRAIPVATTLPTPAAPRRETFWQRINLSCAITGSVTLRYKDNSGAQRFGKPRASLGCGARLSEKLTLRVSAIGYLESGTKSPSDAEFTYALTYRATDKVRLTYSNYSGRFSDSGGALVDSLTSGTLRASYRLPKFTLPNDRTVGCSVGIGLAKPEDTRANLSCSYALTDKIRIGASAYGYFSGHQSSTDADFSYTASYRINKDWSVNYNNYGNNRFFWNKSNNPGQGVLGGSLSVTYRFKF